MSGLCGYVAADRLGSDNPAPIAAMTARLARFDSSRQQTRTSRAAAIGVASTSEAEADLLSDGEYLVAVWGRPDFETGEVRRRGEASSPARQLLEAYRRVGEDAVRTLTGSY